MWDKLCYPVEERGLGFRAFDDVVRVFSCKLWLKVQLKDSAWAEFMRAKYIRSLYPATVTVSRPTTIWRRLEEIRGLVEQNIRWSLGEGLVDFWRDR